MLGIRGRTSRQFPWRSRRGGRRAPRLNSTQETATHHAVSGEIEHRDGGAHFVVMFSFHGQAPERPAKGRRALWRSEVRGETARNWDRGGEGSPPIGIRSPAHQHESESHRQTDTQTDEETDKETDRQRCRREVVKET